MSGTPPGTGRPDFLADGGFGQLSPSKCDNGQVEDTFELLCCGAIIIVIMLSLSLSQASQCDVLTHTAHSKHTSVVVSAQADWCFLPGSVFYGGAQFTLAQIAIYCSQSGSRASSLTCLRGYTSRSTSGLHNCTNMFLPVCRPPCWLAVRRQGLHQNFFGYDCNLPHMCPAPPEKKQNAITARRPCWALPPLRTRVSHPHRELCQIWYRYSTKRKKVSHEISHGACRPSLTGSSLVNALAGMRAGAAAHAVCATEHWPESATVRRDAAQSGALDVSEDSEDETDAGDEDRRGGKREKFCVWCGVPRARFDHHCLFVNACVYERTHRKFVASLALAVCACLCLSVCVCVCL